MVGRLSPSPIGKGHTDSAGQFRLDVPRTSASRFDNFGVVAIAPDMEQAGLTLIPTPSSLNPISSSRLSRSSWADFSMHKVVPRKASMYASD